MNLREISYENVDCIHMAQNSVCWQAVLNMVMNFWFHNNEKSVDQVSGSQLYKKAPVL
jgi:hypothetical protein